MKWKWGAACAVLAWSAVCAQSGDVGDHDDDTVVVVGTRIPTVLDHFGGAAAVITASDVRLHQYRDLTEALASVPGLHVASTGGFGAQTSVFIRGAESDHVLVLIDGVKVTPPGGGIFGFENLQLNDVERIEVLRGPYSAQYGSEGIGGVIHITTRRGEGAPRASARVESGASGTRAVAANLSGRHRRFDFSLGGAWLETGGESATPRRLRGGAGEEDDGYDNLDLKGRVGVEWTRASRLDFNFGYVDSKVERDAGFIPFERSGLESTTREKRYGARWSGDRPQAVWRPSLQATYYSRDFRDRGQGRSQSRGERNKYEWINELFLSDTLKFVAGAETELEKLRDTNGAVDASARTSAVYAQWRFEPLDALALAGGWRNDDPDDFGSERSWQLAAVYAWSGSDLRLRAAYGTAFKAPSLSDRFANYPSLNFRGNPGLDPETSRSWEVGVDQGLPVGGSEPWGELTWGAAYFNNRIRDLIAATASFDTLHNVDSAQIEGIESFVSVDAPDTFGVLGVSGTLNVRVDHTAMRAYDGDRERLLRRPLRKTTLAARWSDTVWSWAVTLDYVGPQHDVRRDNFLRVAKGGYALAHVSARRRFDGQLAVFARINNLFDRGYEPVDGFAGRGAEFHIGVELGL